MFRAGDFERRLSVFQNSKSFANQARGESLGHKVIVVVLVLVLVLLVVVVVVVSNQPLISETEGAGNTRSTKVTWSFAPASASLEKVP